MLVTGAAKRLELLARNEHTTVYRDFAHAPSKVKATIDAVKQQFPDRTLIGVLELHTYSSLNEQFMSEYKGAMDRADKAVVFYSRHALDLKRMDFLDPELVKKGFQKQNLEVITDRKELENKLKTINFFHTNLLFMSSGNYDGLNILSAINIKN